MGFTECNGDFYGATSKHIYKRVDGATPTWQEVFYDPNETNATGIRGLTAVPNPSGTGQVLLFRSSDMIRHIDPSSNFKVTIEVNLNAIMSVKLGATVVYSLCAYNDFLPYTIPGTGEKVYLFGGEFAYPTSVTSTNPDKRVFMAPGTVTYAAEGYYLIRYDDQNGISNELKEVKDTSLPILVSVRTIAVSPFPSDNGKVLYFGGFDCNSQPSHNTGWIYRGILKSK